VVNVSTYLVEHYLPGSPAAERAADVARVCSARDTLAALGAVHISSVIVDTDEMCMHLYSADTEAVVVTAHRSAGLPCDRIVEVSVHGAAGAS
jgi:hypothetical protein